MGATPDLPSILIQYLWSEGGGQDLVGALLLGGASLCSWFDIEPSDEPSLPWAMIDVASHPSKSEVLLQSLSTDLGGHALVYDGEIVLHNPNSSQPSSGHDGGGVLRMKPSVVGPDSENTGRLHPNSPPQWMGQECSGPFTSLAVLDDHALLVVGREKDKSSSTEVLILLQRVPSGWRCWPLLAEGVEKGGVVLRCFRSVWGSATEAQPGGIVQHSCWIWGLCSSKLGWQDRQWKLSWDLSVRPVQVKVELTDVHTGGFSIPTELKSFSLEQLDRRGLLKPGVQQDLQESLIPAMGQSRLQ